MDKKLSAVIDFILNQANDGELEVIDKAVKKRLSGPRSMAAKMSKSIQMQMDQSVSQIHSSMKDYVRALIRENQPDIPEEHIEKLLEAWVPPPEKSSSEKKSGGGGIPKHALLTMIEQFVAYSTGSMPRKEEQQLRSEISDWPEQYWDNFSVSIREKLREYLRGNGSSGAFWRSVKAELEIE